jgi:hypothetical protein
MERMSANAALGRHDESAVPAASSSISSSSPVFAPSLPVIPTSLPPAAAKGYEGKGKRSQVPESSNEDGTRGEPATRKRRTTTEATEDDRSLTSTRSVPVSVYKELLNKRYERKQKMRPDVVGETARYSVHSLHRSHGTHCPRRDFCAKDWCTLHPEGTVGEFNLHYYNLPVEELEVGLFVFYARASMHTDATLGIQPKRKGREESSGGEYNTFNGEVHF